ncbi:DUF1036 domain-containing protein [Pinisolibacter sp.]|uniref:DUF1036 domain-containing protein n=1 Tax=Pinisolibacter sp. TaxID=2172024 RepID=UPI002FDE9284
MTPRTAPAEIGHRFAVPRVRAGAVVAVAVAVLAGGATSALADLRICNKTTSRVGIAVGYKDEESWKTEGWWNLQANSCETLLAGPLVSRYYYLYAVDYDRGGEWSGRSFMCTQEKTFTIKGIEDCLKRGFERTGFFEIDTGEQRTWTVQLTEPGRASTAAGQ